MSRNSDSSCEFEVFWFVAGRHLRVFDRFREEVAADGIKTVFFKLAYAGNERTA